MYIYISTSSLLDRFFPIHCQMEQSALSPSSSMKPIGNSAVEYTTSSIHWSAAKCHWELKSVSFLPKVGFQQRIIATSDSPWFIIRVFHSQPSCSIVDFVQPVLGAKSSDLRHTRSLEISGPCQAPWTSLVPSFCRISKTTATFRSDNFGRCWTCTYAVAY